MEIKKRFGLAVQRARNSAGIRQEELALRLSADQGYVSRVEAGQINVTLHTIEKFTVALEVDVADLFALVRA
jgi:transcriptional regulator with XRE-family HTH domain